MSDVARNIFTACLWEATARKAGNVDRYRDFANLTYLDFAMSAGAIAPVLADFRDRSLGSGVLEAIQATRSVVGSNTNLGIVLLLAPLARCAAGSLRADIAVVLSSTTLADSKSVYEAIRLAVPGGLGRADAQDVADEPTLPLRDVMALAADRDAIARQYACDFADLFEEGVPALLEGYARFGVVEAAILHLQLHLLARFPDTLIARKRGPALAQEASRMARAIDLGTERGRSEYAEFDRWLRADGHARNPGATADLVTACLFIALQEHRMAVKSPFSWNLYV